MSFREELAPYLNQRLKCVGVYESQSTVGAVGRPVIKTALFNEIKIETPKGEELDFDHLWVQFAEDICNTKPKRGDVIEFTAVVNNYHHQARNCEAFGLTKARDVVTEADKEVYRTPLLPPPPGVRPIEVDEAKQRAFDLANQQHFLPKPSAKEVIAAVKGTLQGFSDNGGGVLVAPLEWVIENHHYIGYTVGLVGGVEEFMELAEMLS